MPRLNITYRTKASLGTECVDDAWNRIETWLADHLPMTRKALRPPATAGEIKSFEKSIGMELPAPVRESYRRHNGHKPCSAGIIFGLPLHPLDTILGHWRSWKDYERSRKKFNFDDLTSCFPMESVQPVYFSRNWIPISDDAGGNHIAIDMAPGPRGRTGQIIVCGRDDTFHPVLAWDWAQFLSDIASELERGNWSIQAGDPEFGPEFNLASLNRKHFHDVGANWSRCKLGLRTLPKAEQELWNTRRCQ